MRMPILHRVYGEAAVAKRIILKEKKESQARR